MTLTQNFASRLLNALCVQSSSFSKPEAKISSKLKPKTLGGKKQTERQRGLTERSEVPVKSLFVKTFRSRNVLQARTGLLKSEMEKGLAWLSSRNLLEAKSNLISEKFALKNFVLADFQKFLELSKIPPTPPLITSKDSSKGIFASLKSPLFYSSQKKRKKKKENPYTLCRVKRKKKKEKIGLNLGSKNGLKLGLISPQKTTEFLAKFWSKKELKLGPKMARIYYLARYARTSKFDPKTIPKWSELLDSERLSFLKAVRTSRETNSSCSDWIQGLFYWYCRWNREKGKIILPQPNQLYGEQAKLKFQGYREAREVDEYRVLPERKLTKGFEREKRKLKALAKITGLDPKSILKASPLEFSVEFLKNQGVWDSVASVVNAAD